MPTEQPEAAQGGRSTPSGRGRSPAPPSSCRCYPASPQSTRGWPIDPWCRCRGCTLAATYAAIGRHEQCGSRRYPHSARSPTRSSARPAGSFPPFAQRQLSAPSLSAGRRPSPGSGAWLPSEDFRRPKEARSLERPILTPFRFSRFRFEPDHRRAPDATLQTKCPALREPRRRAGALCGVGEQTPGPAEFRPGEARLRSRPEFAPCRSLPSIHRTTGVPRRVCCLTPVFPCHRLRVHAMFSISATPARQRTARQTWKNEWSKGCRRRTGSR